ncbi:MAG: UDP-N-acetylmuramoyl-L-alanyl-D-glutamate--2,6-diaminopimelate ligase [Oscillospiraceae bacterium]|nr:UDP-N-acetylmuramoyl-L-alanyl-D-glutamate--2,6-diaminopimelate ligase [Oscillospiraceae bacterium]
MKLKEILRDVEVLDLQADMELEISGISCDSRKTKPGDLFVAVKGFESDGHKFVAKAVEKGAVCVLCEDMPETDIPCIRMANTRVGLAAVSANFLGRPAEKLKIVGVTGTSGKTTTTTLIRELIEKLTGEMCGLIGTNVNIVGGVETEASRTTPESIEVQQLLYDMVEAGCKYAVMEVSSHALCLSRVYGIPFEAAVYTNLSLDHLDFHGTMEEYAKAKALLFRQARHGSVNLDDEYASVMLEAAECPMMTYSARDNEADLVAKDIRFSAGGVRFIAVSDEGLDTVKMRIPGRFSVYNALSALSALKMLGLPVADAAKALAECPGVKGRAEVVPTGTDYTVLIDYAHKPDALENILSTIRECAEGRVVTLFGCGGDRDRTKRPVMGEIAARYSDFVVVTSDNPRTEDPMAIIGEILPGLKGSKTPYKVIENRPQAIRWAMENAQPGDTIVLAGKGQETYQEIGHEKFHLDEREVVRDVLAGKA